MMHGGELMSDQNNRTDVSELRSARLLCAVIVFSAAAMAVAGVLAVQLGLCPERILPPELIGALVPVGLAGTLASFPVRWVLLGRLGEAASSAARARVAMIATALAETGATVGLVFALLTETLAASYLLWSVSLAACILHFPSAAWLAGSPETRTPPEE